MTILGDWKLFSEIQELEPGALYVYPIDPLNASQEPTYRLILEVHQGTPEIPQPYICIAELNQYNGEDHVAIKYRSQPADANSFIPVDSELKNSILERYSAVIQQRKAALQKQLDQLDVIDGVIMVEQDPELKYLETQSRLFDAAKPELLKAYEGLWVLFEDGKVLDSDTSHVNLCMRAYKNGGMRARLFTHLVTAEEIKPMSV